MFTLFYLCLEVAVLCVLPVSLPSFHSAYSANGGFSTGCLVGSLPWYGVRAVTTLLLYSLRIACLSTYLLGPLN